VRRKRPDTCNKGEGFPLKGRGGEHAVEKKRRGFQLRSREESGKRRRKTKLKFSKEERDHVIDL